MAYRNFEAAVYCPVRDVERMATNPDLGRDLEFLLSHVQLSKVYLETYRGNHLVDRDKILRLKDFFAEKGIRTSGGFTPDVSGSWEFQPFCYTDPKQMDLLRRVVQYSAELFDEIILDDFFFTNCRCASCIAAKGDRGWPEFRTALLADASRSIVKLARETNPRARMIVKYPNWYDDYQSTGYDLEAEPALFDGIYTGTETRDPRYSQQTLQRYSSYFLLRYLENVKPGKNGGGWFDGYDCMYNLGSYAEQCYLTLFAKAREVTLFSMGSLLYRDRVFVPVAGYAFQAADAFLERLGRPLGIACYKPYHSSGENYLHGYLGMLGLPLEPVPTFPSDRPLVLLTESAVKDPALVERMKAQLRRGGDVAVTSGLLAALGSRGIEEIASVRSGPRRVVARSFGFPMHEASFANYYAPEGEISIPDLEFSTNDCFPLVMAFSESKGHPILLRTRYGSGSLYVLTIPDGPGELYRFPAPVLAEIRKALSRELDVRLEGPSRIGLFLYDNRTLIVESFLSRHCDVTVVARGHGLALLDLVSGARLEGLELGEETHFKMNLTPATYRVFQCQPASP